MKPPKPSTTASTFCCAAASTCSISTSGWACATASSSTASSISSNRAAAFRAAPRAAARAAPFHRVVPAHALPEPRATRPASRGRCWRCAASAPAARISTASACSTGCAETPDAARHRPLLAAGAGQRGQRRSGPHGRACTASRSSGWAFWRAPIPTKWACRRCRSANCTRRCLEAAWPACKFTSAAPVERIDESGFMVDGRNAVRRTTTSARCPSSGWPAVGLACAEIRALADHRRSPVVRPRSDRPAACHPARPHDAVDVQQGARALPATGGQRFARSDCRWRAARSSSSPSAICGCIFPRVREAQLEKAHVIKEQRATFSAAPETEALRPDAGIGVAERFSGRRLDALRLARHHGRRGAQRLPGGGSRGAGGRAPGALPGPRFLTITNK